LASESIHVSAKHQPLILPTTVPNQVHFFELCARQYHSQDIFTGHYWVRTDAFTLHACNHLSASAASSQAKQSSVKHVNLARNKNKPKGMADKAKNYRISSKSNSRSSRGQ